MPARMSRLSSRGWSNWEPTDDAQVYDKSPRIFKSYIAARNARAQYCLGVHRRDAGWDNHWEAPEYNDVTFIDKPKVPRNKDDLEIVAFDMVEVCNSTNT